MSKNRDRTRLGLFIYWSVTVLICGGFMFGVCYALWIAMQTVAPNTARAWALLATGLLPIAAWAGWWFGHTEARGRLRGMDDAVDKVMGGATKIAGLGLRTQQASKAPARRPEPETWRVALPDVEIVERRQLTSGDDVVEL
jgi:hypothetical protein